MPNSAATTLARARRMMGAAVLVASMMLTAQAAPALAEPVLAGQWRFDEGSGQVALDDGPFAIHGVLGAAAQVDGEDPLRVGGAPRFGNGSYVRVADGGRLNLPRLTVEATTRAAASPGTYRYLVAHGSVGCFAGAYGLYTAANGGLAFYVFDGERYFVSASARPDAVWDGACTASPARSTVCACARSSTDARSARRRGRRTAPRSSTSRCPTARTSEATSAPADCRSKAKWTPCGSCPTPSRRHSSPPQRALRLERRPWRPAPTAA